MKLKDITPKMIKGKNTYQRPTLSKLQDIWASDEITNVFIMTRFKKEIARAKKEKKEKKEKKGKKNG